MRGNPENDDPLGFVGLSSWIAELVHSMIGHAAFRDVPLARTISDPIPFAPMHPLLNGSTVLVWTCETHISCFARLLTLQSKWLLPGRRSPLPPSRVNVRLWIFFSAVKRARAALAASAPMDLLLPGLRGELSPPGTMDHPPFTGCQRGVKIDDSVDRKGTENYAHGSLSLSSL